MTFNDRNYTRDAILKQLGLIELHGKDGSAVEGGCACIESKHLFMLEGLSEEGAGFALTDQEKKFYLQVSDFARNLRKRIEAEDWSLHGVMHKTMHNPRPLTACEKKIERCIVELKKKPGAFVDFNPYAVCQAKIKC